MKKTSCMLLVALLMLLCGTALAANDEVHRCYSFSYAYDDEYHWEVCDHCGAIERKGRHVLACAENGTCEYCGATGVSGEVDHYWTGARAGDEQCCWDICGDCGAESEHTPHISNCTDRNPGFCKNCDLPCEIGHWSEQVSVTWGNCVTGSVVEIKCRYCGKEVTIVEECTGECRYEFVSQGDTHAYMCTGCGTTQWTEGHCVSCTGGTTCVDCGAEGVTGEPEHLTIGFSNNATTCWMNCANCDAHVFEGAHMAFCDDTSTCINCQATDVTIQIRHYASKTSAIGYGLTSCWYYCDKCSKAWYHMPHSFADDGACTTCGFAGIATSPVEATVEGETLSADVTLVVEQPQEDVSALLPETVRTSVQQVYMVKLLEKGEAIEPNGSIRITIQLEEGADLTGKKLMLLQEDGTLTEIAYEVVEGKLTFVTKAVGTFVLVDATAE